MRLRYLNVEDIKVDFDQHVRHIDHYDLDELKLDILKNGLQQPLQVNDQNELVHGFRRLKAILELNKGFKHKENDSICPKVLTQNITWCDFEVVPCLVK